MAVAEVVGAEVARVEVVRSLRGWWRWLLARTALVPEAAVGRAAAAVGRGPLQPPSSTHPATPLCAARGGGRSGRRFGHASSKEASAPLRRARANAVAVAVVAATVGRWRPSPLRPRAPLCATGGGGSAWGYKFAHNAGEQALPCTAFGVQESRRSPAALQRMGTMVW